MKTRGSCRRLRPCIRDYLPEGRAAWRSGRASWMGLPRHRERPGRPPESRRSGKTTGWSSPAAWTPSGAVLVRCLERCGVGSNPALFSATGCCTVSGHHSGRCGGCPENGRFSSGHRGRRSAVRFHGSIFARLPAAAGVGDGPGDELGPQADGVHAGHGARLGHHDAGDEGRCCRARSNHSSDKDSNLPPEQGGP